MSERHDTIDCPELITGPAREEWDRVVALLAERDAASPLYRATLALYCAAWSRWQDAEAKILETGGAVVKLPSGFPGKNPWLLVSDGALKQVETLARQLGLTPSKRAKTTRPAKPIDQPELPRVKLHRRQA